MLVTIVENYSGQSKIIYFLTLATLLDYIKERNLQMQLLQT